MDRKVKSSGIITDNYIRKTMRTNWIDACKGIGIILVYYGHMLERFADLDLQSSVSQWVYLYAFHMPAFFILSGYVHTKIISNRITFLKNKLIRIIIPILFFNILFWVLWLIINEKSIDTATLYYYFKKLLDTLYTGNNSYSVLTWFLYCIMGVYVLHAIFAKYLKNKRLLIIAIFIFGLFGHWLTSPYVGSLEISKLLELWYFDEAFVAYAFFLVGQLISSSEKDFTKFFNKKVYFALAIVGIGILYLTVPLNDGPFRWSKQAVIMAVRSHGDLIFYISAIAGSIALIYLVRLLNTNAVLERIGRNSIPYLAMNSAFHVWLNILIIKKVYNYIGFPQGHISTLLIVGLITIGSIAVVTPIVELFSRYIPKLTGADARKRV